MIKKKLGVTKPTFKFDLQRFDGNPSITYIGADGNAVTTTDYTVITADYLATLDNGKLATGTYFVNSNVEYNGKLQLQNAAVNLIIADDVTFSITNNDYGIESYYFDDTLTIYGQSKGTGILNVTNTNTDYNGYCTAIQFSNASLTINGVTVNASAQKSYAICDSGEHSNITINGGTVNTTNTNGKGIYSRGNLIINGGKVNDTSKDGILIQKNLEIGYTNSDDFIKSTNIEVRGNTIFKEGQRFTNSARDVVYSGTLTGTTTFSNAEFKPFEYSVLTLQGVTATCSEDDKVTIDDVTYYKNGAKVTINNTEYTVKGNAAYVSYIDADGNTQYTLATILTGNEETLDGGWYVVNSEISHSGKITTNGAVNLILADSGKFDINGGSSYGIQIGTDSNNDLTIYGQSGGTGTLNVTGGGFSAIDTQTEGGFTINGGIVNVTGNSVAIHSSSPKDVTINGGKVTVNASSKGFMLGGSDLKINGGQVTDNSTEGTHVGNGRGIIIGYKNDTDFFQTTNIAKGTVTIKEGQKFYSGDTVYSGTITDTSTLAGKKLNALDAYQVNLPACVTVTCADADKINIGGTTYYKRDAELTFSIGTDLSYTEITGVTTGEVTVATGGSYTVGSADVTFAINGTEGINWLTKDTDGAYLIQNATDLQNLSNYVNGTGNSSKAHTCESLTFKLANDISDFSGVNFTPIGNSDNSFKGTFDGNGNTISNLKITSTSACQGLFGYVDNGGTIQNLNVSNAEIIGALSLGVIAGYSNGTVTNCNVSGSQVTGSNCYEAATNFYIGGHNLGGIVGNNYGTIKNSTFSGTVSGTENDIGGIAGANSNGTIENCLMFGTATTTSTSATLTANSISRLGTITNSYRVGSATPEDATLAYEITLLSGITVDGNNYVAYNNNLYIPAGDITLKPTSDTYLQDGNGKLYTSVTYGVAANANVGTYTTFTPPTIDGLTFTVDNKHNGYYAISSSEDLQALATYVNAGNTCEGLTFKLTADSEVITVPKNCDLSNFAGTIDGNYQILRGVNNTIGGIVKDLNYTGTATISGDSIVKWHFIRLPDGATVAGARCCW